MDGFVFFEHFRMILDSRQSWKITYKLSDILFLTVASVLAGAEGWEDMEVFGNLRLEWLQKLGLFEHGIPSHFTIARVMGSISPNQFQKCFIRWMEAVHVKSLRKLIAVDGKTLRSSYNRDSKKSAIHMVSAFCVMNQQMLGQIKTADHSNEITAIPELLELLDIEGGLVTIDAMGCQTDIAEKIVNKGADYLLRVKANQGSLKAAFEKELSLEKIDKMSRDELDIFEVSEKGHGREETRQYLVFEPVGDLTKVYGHWKGVSKCCVALSYRKNKNELASEFEVKYYISSRDLNAEEFAESARGHWGIESIFHWILDTSFKEDKCQIYQNNAAENLSYVRRIAFNLIKQDKTNNLSVRKKMKMASWDEAYLSRLLAV